MSLTYREFSLDDFQHLHAAFVDSFSDYFLNFAPTEGQFKKRIINKLNIAPNLSALAWQGDQVASFVLHTINDYQGQRTAYNGGTGTIQKARKTRAATELYKYLLPRIQAAKTDRILLEVIDRNTAAQNLYETLGFQFTRVLKCFKLKNALYSFERTPIQLTEAHQWNHAYDVHMSFEPSFLDSSQQLVHNLNNESIIEARMDGQLVGHIVFQPALGRISQIAVVASHRGKGIGHALIRECQSRSKGANLTIMNIPEDEHDTIEALERIGFKNELDQYELELII